MTAVLVAIANLGRLHHALKIWEDTQGSDDMLIIGMVYSLQMILMESVNIFYLRDFLL